MSPAIGRIVTSARGLLLGGLVVAVGGASAYLATKMPARPPAPSLAAPGTAEAEKVERLDRDTLFVPAAVARNVGLRTAVVAPRSRPLPFPPLHGTLALDSNRLARVHARFAGEVVSLGRTKAVVEPSVTSQPSPTAERPVAVGDRVKAGDLLAVVWSKDLGEKKSELADALSRLRADEAVLRRLDAAFKEASVPERSLRDAERTVEADRIAVERAERTLRTWRLTEDEIAAVRDEKVTAAGRDKLGGWARVEVRSPQDGVILEKNVAAGDIVDTTADLYKVGDLSKLVVWAHVFEEDLPAVEALPKPVRWTVRVPSRPGVEFVGTLSQVGAVIDPNQHTALATGVVDNPAGELKVGQFVTAAVDVPAPRGELELPAAAVVEDGRESAVFVRADAEHYRRVPVDVVCRFHDTLCVRPGGVKAGDHVLTAGALLLRDAMDVLPVGK